MSNPLVKIKMNFGCEDLRPVRKHDDDSGWDLKSATDYIISLYGITIIDTGVTLELPEGYEAVVRPRSGLAAKYGLTCINSPGTIDTGYRGTIKVIMTKCAKHKIDSDISESSYEGKRGDRIAQLVFQKKADIDIKFDVDLSDTVRGDSGLGSTGIK